MYCVLPLVTICKVVPASLIVCSCQHFTRVIYTKVSFYYFTRVYLQFLDTLFTDHTIINLFVYSSHSPLLLSWCYFTFYKFTNIVIVKTDFPHQMVSTSGEIGVIVNQYFLLHLTKSHSEIFC